MKKIEQNRNILFGTLSSKRDKDVGWEEIAIHAQALGLLSVDKNGKYMRDVTWANWKKRSIVCYSHTLC